MESKIDKAIVDTIIPQPGVSFNENMVYLMSHQQPDNDTYTTRIVLRWLNKESKPFNFELFTKAYKFVAERHEVFRYSYHQDQNTGFVQKKISQEAVNLRVPVHRLPYDENHPLFTAYCKEVTKGFFPMVSNPIMRVDLVVDVNQVVYSLISIPHIMTDGHSDASCMVFEVYGLYKRFRELPETEQTFENFAKKLPATVPYSEFVKEEREIFDKKISMVQKYYSELYKKVDLTNKYITLETKEKMVRGILSTFDKTNGFDEFVKQSALAPSQIFYSLFQVALLKCLNLRAVPISKMFNNRKEKFLQTMGFMAYELIYIEEIQDTYTLENLYNSNKESTRNTLRNYGDVNSLVAVKLLGLPLPRFKYNYIPKEMVDLSNEDFSVVFKPDYTETWNWEGPLWEIKCCLTLYEHEKFTYLKVYHTKNDFQNEVADSILDLISQMGSRLKDIWTTPIKDI